MTITEVGRMGVKPGMNIMDDTTPEGQILTGIYRTIISIPSGPSRIYWGLETENPLMLWALFDWDSIDHHEKFAKEFGGEAVKDLPKILTHGEFTKHFALTPFPPLVLKSPVTEVMLAYFSSDISAAGKEAAASELQQFIEKGLGKCSDVKGVSWGWGVENDFPVRDNEDGQKGELLTAFIGWDSVEKHMEFRETNTFKETIGLLRGMEGMVKLAMFHLSCRTLEK